MSHKFGYHGKENIANKILHLHPAYPTSQECIFKQRSMLYSCWDVNMFAISKSAINTGGCCETHWIMIQFPCLISTTADFMKPTLICSRKCLFWLHVFHNGQTKLNESAIWWNLWFYVNCVAMATRYDSIGITFRKTCLNTAIHFSEELFYSYWDMNRLPYNQISLN